ncbi:unnamed protein product [Arctogadus glacialis]
MRLRPKGNQTEKKAKTLPAAQPFCSRRSGSSGLRGHGDLDQGKDVCVKGLRASAVSTSPIPPSRSPVRAGRYPDWPSVHEFFNTTSRFSAADRADVAAAVGVVVTNPRRAPEATARA